MNLFKCKVKETMVKKTPLMRLIELQQGQTIEAIITEMVEAGLNWTEIADKLGVPYPTLNDWRRALGVQTVRSVRFASDEETTSVR